MSVDQLTKAFEQSLVLDDKSSANATLAGYASELSQLQDAELHQWLTVSSRFPEGIAELNETLKGRTYLLDTESATVADAVVLARVSAAVKAWTVDEIKANRHIVRWVDLVQHAIGLPESKRIAVDVNLEAPREIKVKPKKEGDKDAKAKDAKKDSKKDSKKDAKEAKKDVKKEAVTAETKETKAEDKSEATTDAAAVEKKGVKKEKKKKAPAPPKVEVPITPGMIDLRVGFIEKAVKHPDADSLYVSTIQMGDAEGPRTVCSGLVKHFPLEAMQQRYVVVVANLKPVTMRGIKSAAMVLCASTEETVEFVNPPEGSKPGDKIFFETYDIDPEAVLNPKKKIWETVQPGFSTNENLEVTYRKDESETPRKLVNKAGELCKVQSLVGAAVR